MSKTREIRSHHRNDEYYVDFMLGALCLEHLDNSQKADIIEQMMDAAENNQAQTLMSIFKEHIYSHSEPMGFEPESEEEKYISHHANEADANYHY